MMDEGMEMPLVPTALRRFRITLPALQGDTHATHVGVWATGAHPSCGVSEDLVSAQRYGDGERLRLPFPPMACIEDPTLDSTGNHIWPAAVQLSQYLHQRRSALKGKVVVELGAGTGLCGLVASAYCSKVLLTDGSAPTQELLKWNVNHHQESMADGSKSRRRTCKIMWGLLRWGKQDHVKEALRTLGVKAADLVIATDIVYMVVPSPTLAIVELLQEDSSLVPLMQTIRALLVPCRADGKPTSAMSSGEAAAILCFKQRGANAMSRSSSQVEARIEQAAEKVRFHCKWMKVSVHALASTANTINSTLAAGGGADDCQPMLMCILCTDLRKCCWS